VFGDLVTLTHARPHTWHRGRRRLHDHESQVAPVPYGLDAGRASVGAARCHDGLLKPPSRDRAPASSSRSQRCEVRPSERSTAASHSPAAVSSWCVDRITA